MHSLGEQSVRFLRYAAAAFLILLSARGLLGTFFGYNALRDMSVEWIANVAVCLAIPWLLALLMRPGQTQGSQWKNSKEALWRSYWVRLGFSYAFALVAAVLWLLISMVLMDSGLD